MSRTTVKAKAARPADALNEHQSEVRKVHRSKINPAAYNPRTMDAAARRKLRLSIDKFGLVETLVWNERTGNLVGGHQRLADLDKRQATLDYWLLVSVVNLDEKAERELNVALNNPSMQGQYDVELLDSLIRDTSVGFDFEAAGFEPIDLEFLYENAGLDTSFLDATDPASAESREAAEAAAAEIDDALDEADEALRQEKLQAEKLAGIKRRRAEYDAKQVAENETEFYFTAIFRSDARKFAFLKRCGLDPAEMRINGELLAEIFGISLEPDPEAGDDTATDDNPAGATVAPTESVPQSREKNHAKRARSGSSDDRTPEHDAAQSAAGET